MWSPQNNIMDSPLLSQNHVLPNKHTWKMILCAIVAITIVGLVVRGNTSYGILSRAEKYNDGIATNQGDIVESEVGVVATDDSRCSTIGVSMLRQGGHAVDAAVAAALCIGVVFSASSGIGGGAFMVVRSSSTSQTEAFDMRETAPLAASQNMYQNNPKDKTLGPLSMGVPGELAGLHAAWLKHGRLPWKTLFQPAIELAENGFVVTPTLGEYMAGDANKILDDPGLRKLYAPNGTLLKAGDVCRNVELGRTLEVVAEQGPQAFYNGTIGENLVKDVRDAGGILMMEDLRNYKLEVTDATTVNVMGYTVYGMPPPSSGTLALSLVLNILDSYGGPDAARGNLGLHRLIEALKHMLAVRMNLGDPNFVNIDDTIYKMLSPSFAKDIQHMIFDNTTFPPEYYMNRWSQLRDHGTSHMCIVDADRNAVSLTTTVNNHFGAGFRSTSTGILVNNEMDDFSTPTDISPDKLPPAPANFIEPNKRPLSSMTPLIITKDDQLVGVLGGSGGMNIIAAVVQVFLNHFILGMKPLDAVVSPRIYHKLMPNVVRYENLTAHNGDHIELSKESRLFLEERGHQLSGSEALAVTQLIVQTLKTPMNMNRKVGENTKSLTKHGTLTAVSDPRKGGCPAAV
ncbi:hypothetical protein GLYMA_01G005200v4 [Glycine max]|uniref:Glutathione hydrolase n=1 Tax=Glycine max TaxID=3847 RepID=I1J4F4_SOYBN|nr:glutathione hydrolase 3 isoform X1 [Glycine max]KAG5059021.1 hypothetical protein JHK87_000050 [Glycine soja]KAH1264060.1 Glutathione hydrolase 3 [Glycine max]KRH74192.1 hypothetical protein GLYMA_01G005200v4 [Glycine max]|eukprot:XP_003516303.1 glutathione hydrolase 3 [Glycine max]